MKVLLWVGVLAAAFEPKPFGGSENPPRPILSFETWWHRNALVLLDDREAPVERAADLQSGARPSIFALLNAIQLEGRAGAKAVLLLGSRRENEAVGHLRALLDDRLSGRVLAGNRDRPVPMMMRLAAALALGINGDVLAYQGLRLALLDPDQPDALTAAIVIGLSYSNSASDAERFAEILRSRGRRPLTAEAAGAALGRHFLRSAEHTPVLVAALSEADVSVARGAVVGLTHRIAVEPEVTKALRKVAMTHADPTARALALLSLASHGVSSAFEICEFEMRRDDGSKAFAALAFGLLACSHFEDLERCRARVRELKDLEPTAASAAERLFIQAEASQAESGGMLDRNFELPSCLRTLRGIPAGNAVFVANAELTEILDFVVDVARPANSPENSQDK